MEKIIYVRNIIFVYIIFYLRLVNSYVTKEEVLKMKNIYYTRYYCKDDFCASVNDSKDRYVIEIPDKYDNKTTYIVYTCTYDEIENNECLSSMYVSAEEKISLECSKDLECLSNKCYKNHCMFNDETPIVHCDDIYSKPWFRSRRSYMYCGKPPGDTCQKNDECSSKKCLKNSCQHQYDGPSDSESIQDFLEVLIIIGIAVVIILILVIFCCCYNKKNKKDVK